jgi:hypothetical protein
MLLGKINRFHIKGGFMAQVQRPDKGKQRWQMQADHFAAMIVDMQEVLDDPDATPEEKAEATKTMENMKDNLARLNDKHGVQPAV